MKKFIWIGFAVLLAVAAAAVWWNFQNPAWVVGLIAAATASIYKALAPKLLKPMTPEQYKDKRHTENRGWIWNYLKKRGEPRS